MKVSTIAIAASDGGHSNPNPYDSYNISREEASDISYDEVCLQLIPAEPRPLVKIPCLSDDDSSDFGDLPKGNPMGPLSFATRPKSPTPLVPSPMVSTEKAKDSDGSFSCCSCA